ncbi:hypothetical protein A2229_00630 [Candidatus Peregrinibacteria bacterium RIFOXYA2_FULL_33_7]|nr:MAG: hypothetical protein A2229_00630 [Candidatus Peregrinibacteria bacterium RIFOXYA2_FULL_33_7]
MLENILSNIGLTDKEARVYLACLELGTSPASQISLRSGLNRVTTYDVLEKLIQKGFINFYNKQKMRYFSATAPEIIVHETKRKAEDLENSLPDLKRLHGKSAHPRIQYFEGISGIKSLYADSLNAKTEILNFSNSKEIRDHWPEYDHEYVEERVKKKIFLRGISPQDDQGIKVQKEDTKYYREIRLVSSNEFTFTNEINIYDDKVAIASFKGELIGMLIQCQEIADTQKDIFKMAWRYTGKNNT